MYTKKSAGEPSSPAACSAIELLLAAVLLGRFSPLAPHHVGAIRERLRDMNDNELREMVATGKWPNSAIDVTSPEGTKPTAANIEAARDLAVAARRVRAKFGTDKQGKPRDWTEWEDLDEACDAIDRLAAKREEKECP